MSAMIINVEQISKEQARGINTEGVQLWDYGFVICDPLHVMGRIGLLG